MLSEQIDRVSAEIGFIEGNSGYSRDKLQVSLLISDNSEPGKEAIGIFSDKFNLNPELHLADLRNSKGTVTHLKFIEIYANTNYAESGDTLLVGTIRAYQASDILLNPASIDATTLPNNMKIVDVNGEKLIKIELGSEDAVINYPAYFVEKPRISFTGFYDPGTSGVSAENVMATITLSNGSTITSSIFSVGEQLTEIQNNLYMSCNELYDKVELNFRDIRNGESLHGGNFYMGNVKAEWVLPNELSCSPEYAKIDTILYTKKPIEIDGSKDFGYSKDFIVNNINYGQVEGIAAGADMKIIYNDDSYAKCNALWDSKFLYFFIDVNDNDLIENADYSGVRSADGIELYMQAYFRVFDLEEYYQNLKFTFPLGMDSPAYEGHGMPFDFGNTDSTNINFVTIENENGYTLEMAIPWISILKPNDRQVIPDQFLNLYFDINLLDATQSDTCKSILSWANNTGVDNVNTSTSRNRGLIYLSDSSLTDLKMEKGLSGCKVYPNPSNNEIEVDAGKLTIDCIEVISLTGIVVDKMSQLNVSHYKLNIELYKSGPYFIKVKDVKGNQQIFKFIKM